VWSTGAGIELALARNGSRFGRVRLVPGSRGGQGPFVAIDARGDVAMAWTFIDNSFDAGVPAGPCCTRVAAAVRWADGRFSAARTVTVRGTASYIAAITMVSGRAALLIQSGPSDPGPLGLQAGWPLVSSAFSRRGFMPGVPVAPPGALARSAYLRGRVTSVVYSPIGALGRVNFEEARVLDGRSVRGVHGLGALDESGFPPPSFAGIGETDSVEPTGQDAQGGQVVVYESDAAPGARLDAAIRSSSSGFFSANLDALQNDDFHGNYFRTPLLAVAPSGRAIITWERNQQGLVHVVMRAPHRAFRPAGVLALRVAPTAVTAAGATAVNSRGQAVIALASDAAGGSGSALQAILRTQRGTYTPAVTLEGLSLGTIHDDPGAAIDESGRGVVVWTDAAGQVNARRFRAA
jgi:hypothetical protein